jgi:hypothetical protein
MNNDGRLETGADLANQLQRWRVMGILRQELPNVDAAVIASLIGQAEDSFGNQAHTHTDTVQRCFSILEQREKGAK